MMPCFETITTIHRQTTNDRTNINTSIWQLISGQAPAWQKTPQYLVLAVEQEKFMRQSVILQVWTHGASTQCSVQSACVQICCPAIARLIKASTITMVESSLVIFWNENWRFYKESFKERSWLKDHQLKLFVWMKMPGIGFEPTTSESLLSNKIDFSQNKDWFSICRSEMKSLAAILEGSIHCIETLQGACCFLWW